MYCCSATPSSYGWCSSGIEWLKFSIAWGFFSTFFALHLLIIFLIGLRFVTPLATEARVIQHTIQLVPRLPEPTLVTAVLVEQNVPVKKGQPLFQFDRRPYENKVRQLEAQLAQAKQDVLVLKADTQINQQKIARLRADLEFATYQKNLAVNLARRVPGRRRTRRNGRRRSPPTTPPSRKRRPRRLAHGCATRPKSAASTPPWPRCRRSSTRRAITSTTR